MSELVTSIRAVERGAHVEVSIWVNYALAGTLRMRPEEAKRFRTLLERAERIEAAASPPGELIAFVVGLPWQSGASEDYRSRARALLDWLLELRAALTAAPGGGSG